MINGGCCPGGIRRSTVCAMDVICATAEGTGQSGGSRREPRALGQVIRCADLAEKAGAAIARGRAAFRAAFPDATLIRDIVEHRRRDEGGCPLRPTQHLAALGRYAVRRLEAGP